jgi:hypothetical protein
VAVGHTGKVSYARAYLSHSSKVAADFLDRLKFLVNGNLSVILTDNGSEFQKDFEVACQENKLTRYYSRVRTSKDNPEVERMIQTLFYEWLNDGNCYENLYLFNKSITEFLIIYNSLRSHQTLNYLTPLAYAEQTGILSKTLSSSTEFRNNSFLCYTQTFGPSQVGEKYKNTRKG